MREVGTTLRAGTLRRSLISRGEKVHCWTRVESGPRFWKSVIVWEELGCGFFNAIFFFGAEGYKGGLLHLQNKFSFFLKQISKGFHT